jgi:hypothetical protein
VTGPLTNETCYTVSFVQYVSDLMGPRTT